MENKYQSIISNNCVGGYIYKSLKRQLDSPFFWNFIEYDSFLCLIQKFTTINFKNFTFNPEGPNKIIIDGKIKVRYEHYRQSTNGKDEKVMDSLGGGNFYSTNLKDFITNTYLRRLARMNLNPQNILFIYSVQPKDTIEQINELLKTPNLIISDTCCKVSGDRIIDTRSKMAIDEARIIYEEIKNII